jgi:hypothetical protein
VEVADSGWRSGARETLSFDLVFGDRGLVANDFRARLESDLPGSTKGENAPRIGPNARYELSIGLRATGATSVSVHHRLGVLKNVIKLDPDEALPWPLKPMRGRFVPTNDHDFQVQSKPIYESWMWSHSKWPWMRTEQPNLLMAVDAGITVGEEGNRVLYVQRGYVLLPLTQVRKKPVRAVARPVPRPPLRIRPPLEEAEEVAEKWDKVVGLGLGLFGGTHSNPSGLNSIVVVPVVLSAKFGRRFKGFIDLGALISGTPAMAQMQAGGRYAIVYGGTTELGPYLSGGVRNYGYSSVGLFRLGMSGEHYILQGAPSLGLYTNIAAQNITDNPAGSSSLWGAPLWLDLGVVAAF